MVDEKIVRVLLDPARDIVRKLEMSRRLGARRTGGLSLDCALTKMFEGLCQLLSNPSPETRKVGHCCTMQRNNS
jgi:hypothetical protein